MPEHQGPTDQVERIELPSAIQRVRWTDRQAAAGGKAGLEVITQFVGPNSKMKIELEEQSGKNRGKHEFNINADRFWKKIDIPEEAKDALYAIVKLPKHNLEQKSNLLIVLPPIEITNVQWDKTEARRGDVLKLTADIKTVPNGTEGEIEIWEHDEDSAHDLITKIPVKVMGNKVELEWEYEYHEDTDDIPSAEESEKGYNPPEYFFRVIVAGISADSNRLEFKDYIEIELVDQETQESFADEEYVLILPDGSERRGKLDEHGRAKEEDIPPGRCRVEFPNLKGII
jgi:hypothetical protein